MPIRDVEKEASAPKESTSRKRGGDAPPRQEKAARSSSAGRRDKLAGVEDKLTELLSGAAMGQSTLGELFGDPRHIAGGAVTSEFAPKLAAAWVKMARSNNAVATILIRFTEGSEMGEVVFVTAMFALTQAQIYGAVPATIPNPYLPEVPVPPSREVQEYGATAPSDRDAVIVTPPPSDDDGVTPPPPVDMGTRPPPPKGQAAPGSDDAEVTALAEQERQAIEARRRRRGS